MVGVEGRVTAHTKAAGGGPPSDRLTESSQLMDINPATTLPARAFVVCYKRTSGGAA